ncbi:MAG TPA: zf-HC2 domain-containing protein [Gemmatimonadales bacterium]|jgi:anti-sigma factor (TIGR02949 family)|nr:zf-HC2 domain-containing protein [Gemmatimonadales bacterium]
MSQVDCRKAMAKLDEYLKQELTPDLAAEVRRHLEHCRPCFSHARFEENFLAMMETCGRKETCPEKLRAKILAALKSEARRD